jgi:chromosome segregation ATPase
MIANLKLILGTAAAIVVFGLGYSLGARKVANLEAQIDSIKSAASDSQAKLKKSEEDIAKTLKDKEAEYAKQARQLKTEADQKAKDLAAALAGANGRIKSLQAQANSFDAQRAQLALDRDAASPAGRKKLQDEIDAVDQKKKAVMAKALANECLAASVPEEVVGPLVKRN